LVESPIALRALEMMLEIDSNNATTKNLEYEIENMSLNPVEKERSQILDEVSASKQDSAVIESINLFHSRRQGQEHHFKYKEN
jgi:hypothetical protein